MGVYDTPIVLRSPQERSTRVRDAQYELNGNNFFGIDWLKGQVDGDWGQVSAQAADSARHDLGYPDPLCQTGVFGQHLYDFLRTDGKRKKLPPTYLARRIVRLRQRQSIKAQALAFAITQLGITESPPGSNRQKFGEWYGLNGLPWCAIGITYCFVVGAGDTKVFKRGQRTAWAYWAENMARVGQYGLRITHDPQPGDLVVYHYHDGHVEIFEKWLDRTRGLFQTVGFNTSIDSEDNGGAVMRRQRALSWAPTVFVSYPD